MGNAFFTDTKERDTLWDFPGGRVGRNLPVDAGDIPSLVREGSTCCRATTLEPPRCNY